MKSLILVGPSGVGKGTILKRLIERNDYLKFVLSFTTRERRKGEIDGKDYIFVSNREF